MKLPALRFEFEAGGGEAIEASPEQAIDEDDYCGHDES
jgi:hypothetical protein